ncbi:MAG: hypothetical protein L3J04_04445 [Robiginitomaculum sp.]|nr:hypothetical protein [Robiginitomaculum sp.]
MNQNISFPKTLLTGMFVIGFMAVAASSFASPKPTATDAQNFIKKMTLNKMITNLYLIQDYVIVAPCKSTWKYYDSPFSIRTASVDWANIASIESTGFIYINLKGVVTITKEDKQENSTNESFKFPDIATRDRAARAIQVLIDECYALGDAFGEPIDE